MEKEKLLKLQKIEKSILVDIDKFCKENDIKYSLYAGTALGAVRHKGFIPWDDDIDICMEREEYNRFLSLWDKNNEKYDIQSTNDDSTLINHTKIILNGTTLCSKKDLVNPINHGIWVDIFPLDRVPIEGLKRKLLKVYAQIRIVYTRRYIPENVKGLTRFILKLLFSIPKKMQKAIRNKCEKEVTKYNNKQLPLMSLSCPEELSLEYKPNTFDSFEEIMFDGNIFKITSHYDEFLTSCFGNYMQLPPEEDRVCKHNPEVVDFGKYDRV